MAISLHLLVFNYKYTGPLWKRDWLPVHRCNLCQVCDVRYHLLQQGCPLIFHSPWIRDCCQHPVSTSGSQATNQSLNPSNMAGIINNNLIKEETVASQPSPLDSTVFAELHHAASSSNSCISDQNLLFNILTLACFIGPRISEYAQTTQDKVDYHVYPSGTRVIKAFTANDFIFYDKNGHILKKIDDSSFILATSIQITWHIQKNCQNGQKIKLSADTKNPAICPVRGALQMVMRARRLAQPDNMLFAYYRTKKAQLLFITGSRIATLLHEAVKKVQLSTSADNLKKYFAHSLRVWACVLLDMASMSTSFIQNVSAG